MVSHGGFPNIDITKGTTGGLLEPASLSYGIVTKLLREELGFQHLVVTDDLEMGAIARHTPIEGAVLRAFLAGNDMMLICAAPETIRRGHDALLQTARDGKLPEKRIRAALKHIAATRSLVAPPPAFDLEQFWKLSDEIATLNSKLNYTYGGKI